MSGRGSRDSPYGSLLRISSVGLVLAGWMTPFELYQAILWKCSRSLGNHVCPWQDPERTRGPIL